MTQNFAVPPLLCLVPGTQHLLFSQFLTYLSTTARTIALSLILILFNVQSTMFVYTVTAVGWISDNADAYASWLTDGHIQPIVDSGRAVQAAVQRVSDDAVATVAAAAAKPAGAPADAGPAWAVQSVYHFASKDDFDYYVQHVAPGLRADGVAKWGPESGQAVSFIRATAQEAGVYPARA